MLVLVIGGAASGKSSYAEERALALPGPHIYIATMRPFGEEGLARIARHRAARAGKGFETVEREHAVAGLDLPARCTALLEDVGNLLANEMFAGDGSVRDVADEVAGDMLALAARVDNLVVVANEVGAGAEGHDGATRAYIEAMGRINARLAAEADEVVEVVAGIPVALK